MESSMIAALLSLLGTLFGSLSGIVVSCNLTNYRLEQLEHKVYKHNSFAERIPVFEEQLRSLSRRTEVLESERTNS